MIQDLGIKGDIGRPGIVKKSTPPPPPQHFFAPVSFQLFDLIYREETLFNVIKSVTRNGRSILLTALLALILVYLFSIVGFLFLKDDFILEVDRLPDSKAKGWSALALVGCSSRAREGPGRAGSPYAAGPVHEPRLQNHPCVSVCIVGFTPVAQTPGGTGVGVSREDSCLCRLKDLVLQGAGFWG